jgi:hypothetical protein
LSHAGSDACTGGCAPRHQRCKSTRWKSDADLTEGARPRAPRVSAMRRAPRSALRNALAADRWGHRDPQRFVSLVHARPHARPRCLVRRPHAPSCRGGSRADDSSANPHVADTSASSSSEPESHVERSNRPRTPRPRSVFPAFQFQRNPHVAVRHFTTSLASSCLPMPGAAYGGPLARETSMKTRESLSRDSALAAIIGTFARPRGQNSIAHPAHRRRRQGWPPFRFASDARYCPLR